MAMEKHSISRRTVLARGAAAVHIATISAAIVAPVLTDPNSDPIFDLLSEYDRVLEEWNECDPSEIGEYDRIQRNLWTRIVATRPSSLAGCRALAERGASDFTPLDGESRSGADVLFTTIAGALRSLEGRA